KRAVGGWFRLFLVSPWEKGGPVWGRLAGWGWGTSGPLRQGVFGLGEGPVEPQGERLDIGALHRRAAPDAQARRRITISIDVVGDALLLQRGGDGLDERRLRRGGKLCHRRIDDLEAHRRVGAQRRIHGVDATTPAFPWALASARAIDAVSPPIDFAQASVSR